MNTVYYIAGSNSITPVTKFCPCCSARTDFILDKGRHEAWRGGQLVQACFPDMKAEDRETLISGTCPACWDKVFAGGQDS